MAVHSSSDALSQVQRLFTIVHLVGSRRQGRRIGRAQLAQACECSIKTLGRSIRSLRSSGILIEYDAAERTYALSDRGLACSLITMTTTDAMALALMRGLLTDPSSAFPFLAEIDAVLDKASAGLPPALRSLMDDAAAALTDRGGMARDYSHAPLRLLLNAIARHETVEMLYESRSSGTCQRRLMDPYRLDRRDGRYLELQAWCHQHEQVRTFALDRILEARWTGQTFTVRPWEESDIGVIGGLRGGKPIDVEVRFDSIVAPFARERRWPFAATFEEKGDGSILLRGRVIGVEGIVRELLTWRRHAQVLGGPELRARMAEEARAIAALYADP